MSFENFVLAGSRAIRHDLVNALFIAQAYTEIETDQMDQSERLEKIRSQMEKAFSIIDVWKELEVFGKEPSWQELKTFLLKAATQSGRTVDIDVHDVKLKTNGLFHFVVTNLIDNSVRHGGKKEDIKIKISSEIEDSNLLIIYEDDGNGIPGEDKEKIFSQGFGKNTGLGMFFSRQIVELTGGTIIENGTEGARFVLQLPEDIYKIV